jgi:hypothetical protein
MKKHLLRCSFLLLLLVPMTMKADVIFLGANIDPVEGSESGSAFGFVTVTGMDVTATVFYFGFTGILTQAGVFGPPDTFNDVVFGLGFTPGTLGGTATGGTTLSNPEDLANLLGGGDYFNLYTNDPVLGYRGQILPTPEPAAWTMLLVCIGFVGWKMRRRRIA